MRFAVKKLTRSDLTFFEYQYRLQNAGNQKAINLNRRVFVDLIFPLAGEAAGGVARQFPVPVTIYGPGMRSQPQVVTRKVISKGGSQKNWRLNGEFVPDPEFDPTCYHELSADDYVVFGLEGENGLPAAFYLVLLAQAEAQNVPIRDELSAFIGTRPMAEIPENLLAKFVSHAPSDPRIAGDRARSGSAGRGLGSAEGTAKLLYNGLTRGKRLVVLVGERKAVAIAVGNCFRAKEWSKLREWLAPKLTVPSASLPGRLIDQFRFLPRVSRRRGRAVQKVSRTWEVMQMMLAKILGAVALCSTRAG